MTNDAERSILVLTDTRHAPFCHQLNLLYPGCVRVIDVATEAHGLEVLQRYSHVVTMIRRRAAIDRLDYCAVNEFARQGGAVVSCLFEYAHNRGLKMQKTHVADRCRPGLRIRTESDITRGFRCGDVTPWWGKVSQAPNNTHPNQLFQRQIMGVKECNGTHVLGVSTVNGGAVLIEERIGTGRIMALDMLSLMEPFFDSWGSTNKYLFLGNFIGGSVRYGRHYPVKLPYDELCALMREMAACNPNLTCTEEGVCSDGRPLLSLSVGNPKAPACLFFNGIHGWEWESGYGLLHLVELLAADTPPEGLNRDEFFVKVVPQLNPWGYDADTRHNANGVDLNRNFPPGWDEYTGGDDSYQPWDFDYKGPAPASEPETRIAQELVLRHRPVGVLDFHTADYIIMQPHRGDEQRVAAIHAAINDRLANRYLAQKPYSSEYRQVCIPSTTGPRPAQPSLIFDAAQAGVPVSLLIEMSGNRTDTQALVMNTDVTIEICLATMQECLDNSGSKTV